MANKMIEAEGGCHCGLVRFAVRFQSPPELLDCNCSICRKTGFMHLITAADDFTLLTDRTALSEYRFGTGTARHIFCRQCGIKSFYVPRSHPDCISVNWRAIDDVEGIEPNIVPFDGVEWEKAQAQLREAVQ